MARRTGFCRVEVLRMRKPRVEAPGRQKLYIVRIGMTGFALKARGLVVVAFLARFLGDKGSLCRLVFLGKCNVAIGACRSYIRKVRLVRKLERVGCSGRAPRKRKNGQNCEYLKSHFDFQKARNWY